VRLRVYLDGALTTAIGVDPCECGWAKRQAELGTEICGLIESLVLHFLGDSRGA